MAAEDELEACIAGGSNASNIYLDKFTLYETQSKFYIIGSDKSRTIWRVLKIDRLEPSELNICEYAKTYTERECKELVKQIDDENRLNGGLKFVTNCYGIIGFIKFLGPYYMLLITRRRQIGVIYDHAIYAVSKTKMIALANSTIQSNMTYANERRYKKLLCSMDLSKDFFFSYSYHIMRSLQKNVTDSQIGQRFYESMFVWNEFLTRGIQNHLKNTLWTVALVYGFFKQAKFSVSRKIFILTLIARRSRHHAGTRYLKRGVNEKGRVANDVETEQIVFEDSAGRFPTQICSVVQNRGSIPLFWSQETSMLNLKPDIVLHKRDKDYEATRLHFENLVKRYGNPIIILNLIKSKEKKPRESPLRSEFAKAIESINNDIPSENHLKFIHWDLHRHSRSRARGVLTFLGKIAAHALNLTGLFHGELNPTLGSEGARGEIAIMKDIFSVSAYGNGNKSTNNTNVAINQDAPQEDNIQQDGSQEGNMVESVTSGQETSSSRGSNYGFTLVRPIRIQEGVLRTNCIDCLDRTNVAQYAYGLVALGHQLHALSITSLPKIDLNGPLADELMSLYEMMGDTLAIQYGGSAAHNKIFSERRGHWRATVQSQEFFRTLQRHYNNAYMDIEKQAAIDLFLGHFQPQKGKPEIWELDSDQHHNVVEIGCAFADETSSSFKKRSLLNGHIHNESITLASTNLVGERRSSTSSRGNFQEVLGKDISHSLPEISASASDELYSRFTPGMLERQPIVHGEHNSIYEHGDSNFLDLYSLSSPTCINEIDDRLNSLNEDLSTDAVNGINAETAPSGKQTWETEMAGNAEQTSNALSEFSDSFIHWIDYGDTFCHFC